MRSSIVVLLCLLGFTCVTGCTGAYRSRGRITLHGVQPYRASNRDALFSADDVCLNRFADLLIATPPSAVVRRLQSSGIEFDEKRPPWDSIYVATPGPGTPACIKKPSRLAAKIADALNAMMRDELLYENLVADDETLKKVVPYTQAVCPWTDGASGRSGGREIRICNRALLKSMLGSALDLSDDQSFAGGFLKGAFNLAKQPSYTRLNRIAPGQGYRFSFDKLFLRYTEETGGAEILVFVELYRGQDLKPFYAQVISHDVEVPRRSSLNRTTVMTPPFVYGKDEPVLLKLVAVELDNDEERRIADRLRNLGHVAAGAGSLTPYAQAAPVFAEVAAQLVELAKGGDDIEFIYSVAFYPPDSEQVRAYYKPLETRASDYLVELPFVAAQFVALKDEDPARRLPLEDWGDYVYTPVVRLLPSLAWLLWAAPDYAKGSPDYCYFSQSFCWKQFPGVFSVGVDEASTEPANGHASRMAVYNDEIRLAKTEPDDMIGVDLRPGAPYEGKSHIIFSLLRADEGTRDPLESVLSQHLAYLRAQMNDPSEPGRATSDLLSEFGKRSEAMAQVVSIFERFRQAEAGDLDRLQALLAAIKAAPTQEVQGVLVKVLNGALGQNRTAAQYIVDYQRWQSSGNSPYSWDRLANGWETRK